MAKLASTDSDLSIAQDFLKRRKLNHLRATRRADTVTLVAGDDNDPWPRARFRLVPSSGGPSMSPTQQAGGSALPFKLRSKSCSPSSPIPSAGFSPISNPERTSDRLY